MTKAQEGRETSSSHPPESASPAWLRGALWPPREPGPSRPKTVPPHGVRASLGPFGGGAKGMFSACPWVAQRRLCPGTGLPGEEQPHLKRPTRIVGRVSGDMASGRSPVPGPRQEARPRGAQAPAVLPAPHCERPGAPDRRGTPSQPRPPSPRPPAAAGPGTATAAGRPALLPAWATIAPTALVHLGHSSTVTQASRQTGREDRKWQGTGLVTRGDAETPGAGMAHPLCRGADSGTSLQFMKLRVYYFLCIAFHN